MTRISRTAVSLSSCMLMAAVSPSAASDGMLSFPMKQQAQLQFSERKLALDNKKNTALYNEGGTINGAHFVNLYVGTPPQLQTVAIGLGHGVTSFPCDECKGCGHEKSTAKFDRTSSESFIAIACAKQHHCTMHGASCNDNGECETEMQWELDSSSSWTALEGYDTCFLGGADASPNAETKFGLHFGCQTDATGYYRHLVSDGVLGLSPHPSSFVNQMYEAGKISSETFSVCFAPQATAVRGVEEGSLTLGGIDPRLHLNGDMKYARLHHTDNHYNLVLREVYVRAPEFGESVVSTYKADPSAGVGLLNVTKADANGNGVLLDSLSPVTYLDHALFNAFQEVFEAIAGEGSATNGHTLSHEQVTKLPTILFQLEKEKNSDTTTEAAALNSEHPHDVLVAFPPSSYMVYNKDADVYGLGIFKAKDVGDKTILGNNFMSGHDIHFDMENKRIGWVESSCTFKSLFHKGVNTHDSAGIVDNGNKGTCSSGACRGATAVFVIFVIFATGYAVYSCWTSARNQRKTFEGYSVDQYKQNLATGAEQEKDADTSHETADSSLDSINMGEII